MQQVRCSRCDANAKPQAREVRSLFVLLLRGSLLVVSALLVVGRLLVVGAFFVVAALLVVAACRRGRGGRRVELDAGGTRRRSGGLAVGILAVVEEQEHAAADEGQQRDGEHAGVGVVRGGGLI